MNRNPKIYVIYPSTAYTAYIKALECKTPSLERTMVTQHSKHTALYSRYYVYLQITIQIVLIEAIS